MQVTFDVLIQIFILVHMTAPFSMVAFFNYFLTGQNSSVINQNLIAVIKDTIEGKSEAHVKKHKD